MVGCEEPELADEGEPTAITPGAAGIRHEAVAQHLDRHLGLDHLDRLVGEVGGGIGDALDAVAIGPRAPGADQHFVEHVLPALLAAACRHQVWPTFRAGDGAFRHHLRQCRMIASKTR